MADPLMVGIIEEMNRLSVKKCDLPVRQEVIDRWIRWDGYKRGPSVYNVRRVGSMLDLELVWVRKTPRSWLTKGMDEIHGRL